VIAPENIPADETPAAAADDAAVSPAGAHQRRGAPARSRRILLIASVLTLVVCAIDLWMPRTATPAIFYTALLALVASSGVRRLIIPYALIFTALTWVGGFLEPPGGPLWVSLVDRAIVTGVLWLTALLTIRRERDLQALDDLSRELARKNADLDQFAGVVAHDIRSPLATAVLYAELMNSAPADEEKYGEEVIRSLHEMSQLIHDLLESTRRPLRDSDCDTESVLQRVLRTMEAELRAGHAQVSHDPLPRVHADEAQVRQVFQNLIQNSIKYRGPDPLRIHISVTPQDGQYTFCVRDNGVGVRADDASRIFQRFARAPGATGPAGRAAGVGLGLSVCKRIIERHGGRIWVEPADADAPGAAFRFTLPA
jgi:signal transduction histidine kinase